MKKQFVILFTAVVAVILSGCAGLSIMPDTGKSEISLYQRDDIDTAKSKVVVFPLLLVADNFSQANKDTDTKILDALISTVWVNEIGTDAIIPIPKEAISKIPSGWKTLGEFVLMLDSVSAIEQSVKDPQMLNFLQKLSTKIGDGALGFTLVFQDADNYKATRMLQGHIGLFDTKTLTWKWITKYKKMYNLAIPYQVAINDFLDASLKKVKEKNNGKIR